MSLRTIPDEREVLAGLVAWGGAWPAIRAMILTSSRERPERRVDLLSDYDVILAVADPDRFGREEAWLSAYGAPLVRWGDQDRLYGLTTYFRGVIYEDYVKIDYTVWPEALLDRVAEQDTLPEELDAGYRVLLDKDGRTGGWKPPTYRAFIPARPTEAEYRALLEEIWWGATYVAKSLWRDEIAFARWVLDEDIKLNALRRLLEWRIELDHGWSVRPGVLGRDLKRRLPPETWSEFERTYVGPGLEENWAALYRTIALFRRVAREVGSALGYAYPQQLDEKMCGYLDEIRRLK